MTPEEVRAKSRARLAAVVGDETLARQLDAMAWNATVAHCKDERIQLVWENPHVRWWYTHKVLSVERNLKTNSALRDKVVGGEMGVRAFFAMKPWEMRPDLWEKAFEAAARKELRNSEYHPDPEDVPDGAFTCGKCKSRKTTYYEMQTRSAVSRGKRAVGNAPVFYAPLRVIVTRRD